VVYNIGATGKEVLGLSDNPTTYVCVHCGYELVPDEKETIVPIDAKAPKPAGLGDDPLGLFSRGKDTPNVTEYLITLCPGCRKNEWRKKE
jgi:hypothetical protein